jgi:aconitate hydratase
MAKDSFGTQGTLSVGGREYAVRRLNALEQRGFSLAGLPYSIKVMLENALRREDGRAVTAEMAEALARWPAGAGQSEMSFMPARVILQDFTGVPVVADLAAMRDAVRDLGGEPERVNPLKPVDLVIDHSVQVDVFGTPQALERNVEFEFERNRERYLFLRWGQQALRNFKVVPPDTGIVHQVNLEYLASVVFVSAQGEAYPDTVLGTDSHTTMINGLGVVGWGVGGIEAEAAMLGQSLPMLIPEVIGVRVRGRMRPGTLATDVVLTVTQMLRAKGVVGKFVEYFGPGIASLSVADRATLANMAPEYGATVGFFPIDALTLEYLRLTGRAAEQIALVEAYAKEQGLFWTSETPAPEFSDVVELDLEAVEPSLAGPRRPQDRVRLAAAKREFRRELAGEIKARGVALDAGAVERWIESAARNGRAGDPAPGELGRNVSVSAEAGRAEIGHGSVLIAAITSCTNTSNPAAMLAAGLLAKNAVERGLASKPWVKTSLAPGSKVVSRYLQKAGLMAYLERLRFNLVGYGCTTCIGNSGPLSEAIASAVKQGDLVACAVLSGNRNFEGRINPLTRFSYLASPALVVAYALVGSMDIDLDAQPLGTGRDGKPVWLKDIWPDAEQLSATVARAVQAAMFRDEYGRVFEGDERWRGLKTVASELYPWEEGSTYVRRPPFFDDLPLTPPALTDIRGARVLAMLGDSVTTDHISPAGSIPPESPAGKYLIEHGVKPRDFNSYGARRGNHEVMVRGTFANIRLRNLLLDGVEGGFTLHLPDGEKTTIFEAAERYRAEGVPLLVIGGKEYGSGSSRDWAAKGTQLLGVRAVLAESFERIHRSNLVGMGVLPLEFMPGENARVLGLTGREVYTIEGLSAGAKRGQQLKVRVRNNGSEREFMARSRVDTPEEQEYLRHGGILPYVLRQSLRAKAEG